MTGRQSSLATPHRVHRFGLSVLLLALLAAAAPSAAAPKLDDLRKAGTVGERYDGYAVARGDKPSAEVKQVVDEVNAKRKGIYEKRAAEENVPVEQVGRVYAKKLFEEAPPGTWFLGENREWVQKK